MTGTPPVEREQRQQRLRLMEHSLVEGCPSTEVVRTAAARFGLTERQCWHDLKTIRLRWRKEGVEFRKDRLIALNRAVRQRQRVYRDALLANDFAQALKALDSEAELLSLKDRPRQP